MAAIVSLAEAANAPEERISNLLSLLTLDEKIALLSTTLGVSRLGIPNTENVEGIHGLVVTGFLGGGMLDIPTTPATGRSPRC